MAQVALLAPLLLAGCRTGDLGAEAVSPAPPAAASAEAGSWPLAPKAEAARNGPWRGGPEPLSGKLPAGIAVYYRVAPATAPGTFTVTLRLEDVVGDDGTLRLSTGDGAQFAPGTTTRAWRLAPNAPALVSVQVVAPPGDSYLHVLTGQRGRVSSRSILLNTPAAQTTGPASARPGYTVDASGEPVVRRQTAP